MKLNAQVKLVVTPDQADALKRTMQAANAVCDGIGAWAWQNQTFGHYPLHKAQYAAQRAASGLTAQVVVRCIGKVADAYKAAFTLHRRHTADAEQRSARLAAKGKPPVPVMEACTFQPTGAIACDDRILNWYVEREQVSIWSVDGRLRLPFMCGDYQRGLLAFRQGEADLAFVNGEFYLMATVSIPDPPLIVTDGVLGIDLGIVNIATDSEGRSYSGEAMKAVRRRMRRIRGLLQSRGTKNAGRHLRRVRRRQSNYTRWLNHNIAKRIVQNALSSHKALATEALTGIRERATGFNREMRWQMGNWSFDRLKRFVAYKARRAGVPVVFVDPRNTSRTCSGCGHCDKANRKSRSQFLCLSCGRESDADENAAKNIAVRGKVTCPNDGTTAYA